MKTRRIVFMGLLIAVSFLGANLKIMSSIALDSMPAFLGALILGPVYGGIIAALGHILTAATSGFPFGLPIHMITMLSMFLAVYLFGKIYSTASKKFNKKIALIVGTIIAVTFNGPVALLFITPFMGMAAFALTPALSLAALVNVIFAQLIYLALPAFAREKFREVRK